MNDKHHFISFSVPESFTGIQKCLLICYVVVIVIIKDNLMMRRWDRKGIEHNGLEWAQLVRGLTMGDLILSAI